MPFSTRLVTNNNESCPPIYLPAVSTWAFRKIINGIRSFWWPCPILKLTVLNDGSSSENKSGRRRFRTSHEKLNLKNLICDVMGSISSGMEIAAFETSIKLVIMSYSRRIK